MEGLAHLRIIESHVTSYRVDGDLSGSAEAINGCLSPVDQRLDIAGVIGVPLWEVNGKDEAYRGF